jgi:hypothetical protein
MDFMMSLELASNQTKDIFVQSEVVSLGWYAHVAQVAKAAGLPIFEDLLCRKSTPVRVNSGSGALRDLSSSQEFVSLEAFVGQVVTPGEQSYTWEKWELEARAAAKAKAFSISSDFHPQEIIEFYEDVEGFLNRRPADPQEFWHVLSLVTKNRNASRYAAAELEAKNLRERLSATEMAESEALNQAERLQTEIDAQSQIIGVIPSDFSERFKSLEHLTALYDSEVEKSGNLAQDIDLLESDLAINDRLTAELESQLRALESQQDRGLAEDLRKAIEEAALASKMVVDLQNEKAESVALIEAKANANSYLKKMNRKLTLLAQDRAKHIGVLERKTDVGKRMNTRLMSLARTNKEDIRRSKNQIKMHASEKAHLLVEMAKARRVKIACVTASLATGSFALILALHIASM